MQRRFRYILCCHNVYASVYLSQLHKVCAESFGGLILFCVKKREGKKKLWGKGVCTEKEKKRKKLLTSKLKRKQQREAQRHTINFSKSISEVDLKKKSKAAG